MKTLTEIPSTENPEESLSAVVALRLMADRLERESVQKAIAQDWTWVQIAQALGVTKQAVHKKHAKFINKK